ncbi:hypothetical protein STRMOE7_21225 [Streptomyces sp. MOE7]|nr:hypothetical protein STRMOE7_21225 [Streptomyces sp. MOE7]
MMISLPRGAGLGCAGDLAVDDLVVDRLHQAQTTEPQDDLGMDSCAASRPGHPFDGPLGVERCGLLVAGDVADRLKSPPRRWSRAPHEVVDSSTILADY